MTSLASSIVYLIEIHADEAVLVKALQSGHLLLVGSQEPWLSITTAFFHSGARPKLSGRMVQRNDIETFNTTHLIVFQRNVERGCVSSDT
jgi:hypothetical protein